MAGGKNQRFFPPQTFHFTDEEPCHFFEGFLLVFAHKVKTNGKDKSEILVF